jgi:hypothetical protein
VLDELPRAYTPELYQAKVDTVYLKWTPIIGPPA